MLNRIRCQSRSGILASGVRGDKKMGSFSKISVIYAILFPERR